MLGKRRLPKFVKLLGIVCVLTMVVSIGTMIAGAAGNYHDSPYEYNPGNLVTSSTQTPYRDKDDASSAYLNNKASNVALKVRPYGMKVLDSAPYNKKEDCSTSSIKTVGVGKWSYIPNYVRERGYTYCALNLSYNAMPYAYVYVLWSPDSI